MRPIRCLLTNDDGIHAPGLRHLWNALRQEGYALSIVAPAHERSGAGVSISWDRPLSVQEIPWEAGTPAWSVDGSPADCVKIALAFLLECKPDLILSGINAGSNAGRNVLHSGTIGAVIEGIFRGIPGIAFSCENGKDPNFALAEEFIPLFVSYQLAEPLPPGRLLNVNFPQSVSHRTEVRGFRITQQGKGRWVETPYQHLASSYFLGGKPEESVEEEDCDVALLRQGYITAAPLQVNNLTDPSELTKRRADFERFFTLRK